MVVRELVTLLIVGLLFWGHRLAPQALPTTGLTLTVNWTSDGSDLNPGDGICDASVNVGEQCSLRAAIEELDDRFPDTSLNRIEFNIPGTGPFTILPETPLPQILVPIEIDGATQPGSSCPTSSAPAHLLIELVGSNLTVAYFGLSFILGSDGSLVHGLAIGDFGWSGISIESSGVRVSCTQVGIGADGITNIGNGRHGIHISGDNNTIGGFSSASQRNVFSNNARNGVALSANADNNSIAQNFIGTTVDGMGAAANQAGGIYIDGVDNAVFGAPFAGGENIISGNTGYGIRIENGDQSVILRNYIGIARDGITSLPNGANGIEILGQAFDNEIGGPVFYARAAGLAPFTNANWIAYNAGHGIVLGNTGGNDPDANMLYQNAIYANGGLGIDLGNDGVDINDPGDGDDGPNGHQNYPVLSGVTGSPILTVTLQSEGDREYDIDLFRNQTCDPSGYGEGQGYITTIMITTDTSGNVATDIDLRGIASPGDSITALARGDLGVTSEFSNCVTLIGVDHTYSTFVPFVQH
jgi:hypothetical protein